MNDLISRKALLEAYDKAHQGSPGAARKLIEEAPEAIVRCKDCKHKGNSVFREDGTEYIVCWNQGYGMQHPCDWFCADGEQKDT